MHVQCQQKRDQNMDELQVSLVILSSKHLIEKTISWSLACNVELRQAIHKHELKTRSCITVCSLLCYILIGGEGQTE